jgi:hypothetical protein
MKIAPDGTQTLITQSVDTHFDLTNDARNSLLHGTLPNGIAFASNGDILIANFGTDRLEIMTRDGSLDAVVTMTTRMPLRRERACGLKGGPKRSRLPAHLRRGSAIGGRKPSRLAWAVDAEFRTPKQSSSATALKCLPYRRSWVMKSCPFVNRNPRAGLAAALNVLKIPFRVFSSCTTRP